MTTKEQERKALAQIRKIIDGLGEDSYIGTALEGCLEIAADNIENDFACSMMQRAVSAETLADTLRKSNENLMKEMEKKDSKIDQQRDCISQLNGIIRESEKKHLTPNLFRSIWNMVYDQEERSRKNMMRDADLMATLAETPTDIAFSQAVKNFKRSKEKAEEAAQIMEELEKIKP